MQEAYEIRVGTVGRARCDVLDMDGGRWYVQNVYVPPRHRHCGYGQRLLDMVLLDADLAGVTLTLEIQSDHSPRSLNDGQLRAWYERMGFEATSREGPNGNTLYMRPPLPEGGAASVA